MNFLIKRRFFPTLALAKTLEKELNYERSLKKPIPFLTKYTTSYSSQFLNPFTGVLSKKTGVFNIEIHWYCAKPQERFEADPEEIEPTAPELFDMAGFVIGIHKEEDEWLYLDCTSINSSVSIHHITFRQKVKEPRLLFLKPGSALLFQTLSPKLQSLVLDWLLSLGINEDIGKFCELASLQREHELYIDWLQKVQSYVSSSLP